MKISENKLYVENRINKLSANQKDNQNIIKKLRRKLRSMQQGIAMSNTVPDWVKIMFKMYDSPNDWESDNRRCEVYTCKHCGAYHQRKTICEFCGERNEEFIIPVR